MQCSSEMDIRYVRYVREKVTHFQTPRESFVFSTYVRVQSVSPIYTKYAF